MELDFNQILGYQKNRPPYLMIDHVTNVVPGVSCSGYKILKPDEWFFKVHWENDPNMPGMLQIEALVQMCSMAIFTMDGNKGKTVYLTNVDKVQLKKKILPNDILDIDTKIVKFRHGIAYCEGMGMVKNQLACKAIFKVILSGQILKIKK